MIMRSSQSLARAIICVVGARPNFMKMAPILRALADSTPALPTLLVHTGQHYDHEMNDQLFIDLDLPVPDINLAVGSGSHAVQTAEIMRKFEPIIDQHNPSCVLVVGDVNSTLACSLVAAKKNVPVAHVEAGLRSGDRSMPEEINRILTDQLATRLYITERAALSNLTDEGIAAERVFFSGNVMIDTVMACRNRASEASLVLSANGQNAEFLKRNKGYALITLHRPSNVDNKEILSNLLHIFNQVSLRLPLIFTLHPRTKSNITRFGLSSILNEKHITLLPPQGYLQMLALMSDAKMVMTDSGGIQEETTALGIPCLTLRDNTERPITIEQGTNTLVGTSGSAIHNEIDAILMGKGKKGRIPELWDGRAATRIANDLKTWLNI